MLKLYEKHEVGFAVAWIVVYCIATIPIRGQLGDESIVMLAVLALIAAGITAFIKRYHLEEKYGLSAWPAAPGRFLYFIPVWILATGNLWGGFRVAYDGLSQLWAVLSMLLIGYVEEVIFRGFLFQGMLKTDGVRKSVIVSAVTFGIGHIVNLLAGQAGPETVIQVFFAIAWGFLFTGIFYKSKSLLPCVAAHGMVNALSKFGRENLTMEWVYMIATILVAVVYCMILFRLPEKKDV